MRVLVFSAQRGGGHINDPIHRGFFNAFPGEVVWYGPGENYNPSDPGPKFDANKPLHVLVEQVKPDLILVNMKKRVVSWMNPKELRGLYIPKAIVEVDFCYEPDGKWYVACGFDMVFFRGYVDYANSTLPKKSWLPFSVDPAWVCIPDENEDRLHDVGFMGTTWPVENYPVRNRAIDALGERLAKPPKVYGDNYALWWRKCRIGLTCSSKWRYENAKHVIIPAAGALLLTDGTRGLPMLLPAPAYETYDGSCADLRTVVDRLLASTILLERRRHAAQRVQQLHTHPTRWADLLATIGVKP